MSDLYNRNDGMAVVECQQQNIRVLSRGDNRHRLVDPREGDVAPCLIAIDRYRVPILYSTQAVLIDRLGEDEALTAVRLFWNG
jgi:hypothetical protein